MFVILGAGALAGPSRPRSRIWARKCRWGKGPLGRATGFRKQTSRQRPGCRSPIWREAWSPQKAFAEGGTRYTPGWGAQGAQDLPTTRAGVWRRGGDRKTLTRLGLHTLGLQESAGASMASTERGRPVWATGFREKPEDVHKHREGRHAGGRRGRCGVRGGAAPRGPAHPSSSPGPYLDPVLIHCWG